MIIKDIGDEYAININVLSLNQCLFNLYEFLNETELNELKLTLQIMNI